MSKTAAEKLSDDDVIFRVESIPPPDGEDVHDCATKVGDWALALAEKQRAVATAQATSKVNAFDLAGALAKTTRPSSGPTAAEPDVDEGAISGERIRGVPALAAMAAPVLEEIEEAEETCTRRATGLASADYDVIRELTIDVEEDAPVRVRRDDASTPRPARSLPISGRAMFEVLFVLVVLVAAAFLMRR